MVSPAFRKTTRWLLRLTLSVATAFGVLILAAFIFVQNVSLERYKPRLLEALKKSIGAERAEVSTLTWTASLRRLSLGVSAKKVVLIEGKSFEKILLPSLDLSVQPLMLLTGKIPVQIYSSGATVGLRENTLHGVPHAEALTEPVQAANTLLSSLPRWAKLLRIDFSLVSTEVETSNPDDSFDVEDFRLVLKGIPGSFKGDVKVLPHISGKTWQFGGSASCEFSGFFLVEADKIVGLRIPQLEVDLKELDVAGPFFFHKTEQDELRFKSQLQAVFAPDLSVDTILIDSGLVEFGELEIKTNASYSFAKKEFSFRWDSPKTELKGLKLPFEKISAFGFMGIFQSSGSVKKSNDVASGDWSFQLNNFRVPAAQIQAAIGQEGSGDFVLSMRTEGTFEGTHVQSPHSELQLHGTQARVDLIPGILSKPAGDPLELLVQAHAQDDQLTFDKIGFSLNTLELNGQASLKKLDRALAGETGLLNVELKSNRADLSEWGHYFIRRSKPLPIEGVFEATGSIDTPFPFSKLNPEDDLSWRLDRLRVSGLRIFYDDEQLANMAGLSSKKGGLSVHGPLLLDVGFSGRGKGDAVDRGNLSLQFNASQASMTYRDLFKKPKDIPFDLKLVAEQSKSQLIVRQGMLRLHELGLELSGQLATGGTSGSIQMKMLKPIRLSNWKDLVIGSADKPVDGFLQWNGRLNLPAGNGAHDELRWRDISLDGRLDVKGLSFAPVEGRPILSQCVGALQVSRDSIALLPTKGEYKGKPFSASGRLVRGQKSKNKSISLASLLKDQGWKFSGSLDLAEIPQSTNLNEDKNDEALPDGSKKVRPRAVARPGSPRYGDDTPIADDRILNNEFDLALSIKKALLPSLEAENVRARIAWDGGTISVQPFSAQVFEGTVSGSLTADAKGLIELHSAPQIALSVQTRNLSLEKLGSFAGFPTNFKPKGLLSSHGTFGMQGIAADEWRASLKGRITGDVARGDLPMLQIFQDKLSESLHSSKVRDYLSGVFDQQKCVQNQFTSNFDMQLTGNSINIASSQMSFANQSRLEFVGGASASKLDIKGVFLAGSSCISGDLRNCLSKDGKVSLPFAVAGNFDQPKTSLEMGTLGEKAALCIADKIASRANSAVQQELKKRGGQIVNDIKSLIPGQKK